MWFRAWGKQTAEEQKSNKGGNEQKAPSFMDTPAWMQVVERRREQAAEEARSRPAKAGILEKEAKTPNETRLMPVCNKPRVVIPA